MNNVTEKKEAEVIKEAEETQEAEVTKEVEVTQEPEIAQEEITYQTIAEFLESNPPNQLIHISDLVEWKSPEQYISNQHIMRTPELQLHCSHESCNGIRFFRCVSEQGAVLNSDNWEFFFLIYKCSNCQQIEKIFSLAAKVDADGKPYGECYKFGELPIYGPPVPPRLIDLVNLDRDVFLKGRRCENQGLGIAAFIYYRKVVENQKNRIIESIIKASEKVGASENKIRTLRAALNEAQFSKALDMTTDAIPESLLINGYSPLLLLNTALSEDIYALTDERCLELASSVRVVLGELSERLSLALKNEVALTKALSALMSHKHD